MSAGSSLVPGEVGDGQGACIVRGCEWLVALSGR